MTRLFSLVCVVSLSVGCVEMPCRGGCVSVTEPGRPPEPEPDPESNGVTLIEGGSYAGECGGACQSELALDGAAVSFIAKGWDDTIYAENAGLLTEDGLAFLATIEEDLAWTGGLQETYGCPDCDDGGATWARFAWDDGAVTTHTWEAGNAPAVMVDADALVADLAVALRTCVSSEWVTVHAGCVGV